MKDAFSNLAQVIEEDRRATKNLTAYNSTLTDQVALYANILSTKEVEYAALKWTVQNLQGEAKNIKNKHEGFPLQERRRRHLQGQVIKYPILERKS